MEYKSTIGEYLVYDDLYGYQQFYNDFVHIQKIHISHDNDSQTFICKQINEKYQCDLKICHANDRHSRQRKFSNDIQELVFRETKPSNKTDIFFENDQSLLYSQKCDDVHAYFLHSS